ncbi:MAG: ABC transporter permease [Rhodobacteraceae bacterium]|nr:ABC transporter permease [Paracoccaceae bacterium]
MTVFIFRRLLQSVVVMFAMTLIVFAGVYLVGDPAQVLVAPDADAADVERMRRVLGLDQPLWRQLLLFFANLSSGDLGMSFAYGEPALKLIFQRMPATLELVFAAMAMALVVGVPLGLYAGLKPEARLARLVMGASIVGVSIPNFWQGLVFIFIFAVILQALPAGGRGEAVVVLGIRSSLWTVEGWTHVFLPALNLALFQCTMVIRLVRTNVREIALLDFVRFARAKGLARRRIVYVHILRNTLVVLVTIVGLQLGTLIAYSVVTETIFAWPGMGKLIIDSVYRLDRPVIVAYLLVVVAMFIVINLVVDILYSIIDPRIRLRDSGGS